METAEPAALVPLRTLETSCAMDSSSSASAARRAERRRRASMRDMAPRGRGQAAGAPVMTSPRACRCNRNCGNGLSPGACGEQGRRATRDRETGEQRQKSQWTRNRNKAAQKSQTGQ